MPLARTRTIAFCYDITCFIRIQIRLEDIRIRLMTNSQEESINSQIITFFIRFTHTFHQMNTFYTVLSKQTYGIMFKQYIDIFMLHHTLLHDLRST